MSDQKKVSHAQHLKAVNRLIRRDIHKFINEVEHISKTELLKKLIQNNILSDENVFNINIDFLIQSLCVEKI